MVRLLVGRDLKRAGLPPLSWYDVLLELKRAPEGKLRFHEIAMRILLDKSNMSRLIERLEKEKLLMRETDRRGAYAIITDQGRALLQKMWPVYRGAIQAHFGSKLTQSEAENLLKLCQRLFKQEPWMRFKKYVRLARKNHPLGRATSRQRSFAFDHRHKVAHGAGHLFRTIAGNKVSPRK
jgi:DNA-binding MarR family transcriptional regulator